MVTEPEAKTKWCPLSRLLTIDAEGTIYSGFNRGYDQQDRSAIIHESAKCLGSACMFWRWGPTGPTTSEPVGHCGAAGPFHL